MDSLIDMLSADVVVYGDSSGVSPSWRRPIVGRERVRRLLAGLGRHSRLRGGSMRRAEVNGQPGVMFLAADGSFIHVLTIDIADGVVQTVRTVINREKLRHLGPLADIRAVLREMKAHRG
jgi:RNA polymerase sigma-70 factor (ECF subfamily)